MFTVCLFRQTKWETSAVFAFIVAIHLKRTFFRAGNDTINTMVTRRTKHIGTGQHNFATKQRVHRRSVSPYRDSKNSQSSSDNLRIPTPNNGEILLTRRHFLYGALGLGALAAVGGGASVVSQKMNQDETSPKVLEVPNSAIILSDSLKQVKDYTDRMNLVGSYELPYGSLVWANDEKIAACLIPTDGANPLTQAALLSLSTGSYDTVLEAAVGNSEGYEIYDVRATSAGLVWTEADILEEVWRIYTAKLSGGSLSSPVLVAEGTADYDTPFITAVGDCAFFQVMPKADGKKSEEDSCLYRVTLGSDKPKKIYASHGRMATAPYGLSDSVVITPRADASNVYYQLTRIDASSGKTTDTLTLPASMKPLEAGFGETGFMFAFDATYDYGEGISELGTYAPASTVTDGSYNTAPWFRFNRDPSAAPAWCGPYLMVKSTTAVCGVDLKKNEYFAFDVESGADTYGEYLATTGSHDTVVTFTNIDHVPLSDDKVHCCRVRVWTPT